MRELGKLIKEKRKEKRLTLAKLGELSNLTHGYLSNIENSNKKPSPEVLKKLGRILEIPYSTLLFEAGYEELFEAVKISEAFADFAEPVDSDIEKVVLRINALEKTIDLKDFLEQDLIDLIIEDVKPYYNGHLLTNQDRKRILAMLEILFPEYQAKGKALDK